METILLLEDERSVTELLKTVLERIGFSVLPSITGDEAISICAQHQGPIRLLIADVVLKGAKHGVEVAKHLNALRPETAVLFISGYPEGQLAQQGLLDPAKVISPKVAFLQKPFSPATL